MPITKVEAPDGSIIKVEHPEGASQEDILAFASANYRPASVQAAPEAARGSLADPVAQGMTLGFSDELAGLLGAVPAAISTGNSVVDAYKGIRDAARENYQGYREQNPVASTAAEIGGGLLTGGMGGGRALAGTAGRQMLARAAATGAGLGAASGAGYSNADNLQGLLADTALGGATGAITGAAFPAAGQAVNALGRRVGSIADDVGIRLTPGARYGSPTLRKVEASLESFPLTSPAFTKLREGNQAAINRAAAESIGSSGNTLKGGVLGAARARLNAEFERLTQGRTITIDQDFSDAMQTIRQSLESPLASAKKGRKILDAIDEITSSGQITDRTYQDISSEVTDSLMAKGVKGKSKKALRDAKEAIDNLFERNLGGEELDAFRTARTQWRNLMNLKKAVNVGTGNVSGLKLANRLATNDETGYVFGQNKSPLYQAARAAQEYSDIVGDSGTATRASIPMMLNMLAGGGFGAAGSAMTGGDPWAGAAYGAAGLLGAPLLTRAYLAAGAPITGSALRRVGVAPAALSGLLVSNR